MSGMQACASIWLACFLGKQALLLVLQLLLFPLLLKRPLLLLLFLLLLVLSSSSSHQPVKYKQFKLHPQA